MNLKKEWSQSKTLKKNSKYFKIKSDEYKQWLNNRMILRRKFKELVPRIDFVS